MATRHRDSFSEINITPLTDIFLVLLIIMMVIAPLLDQQGLNLTVPQMVEQEQINENKNLIVYVSDSNQYFIDEQEISTEELESVIKSRIKELPDGLVIETSPESTHGAVVKLMDIARNSGVTSMSVVEGS